MTVRAAALLLLTLPALAQNDPALTGSPCLQLANVSEYRVLPGGRSLAIIDRLHRQYRVTFQAVCDSLQVHPNLGFRTMTNSQFACISRGDSIYSSNDVEAGRLCRIQAIDWFNVEPPPPSGGRGRG